MAEEISERSSLEDETGAFFFCKQKGKGAPASVLALARENRKKKRNANQISTKTKHQRFPFSRRLDPISMQDCD